MLIKNQMFLKGFIIIRFKHFWGNFNEVLLYLKGYKSLLSQNEQVRNDFFGFRYEALAKDIKKIFFKKTLKWKDVSALTIAIKLVILCKISSLT